MKNFIKLFSTGLLILSCCVITITAFVVGYIKGYGLGVSDAQIVFQKYLSSNVSSTTRPVATTTPIKTNRPITTPVAWGGPQLWDAVNKSRVEHGVNPLKEKDELCTIASIRLNQLLDLGKLDGHVGFSNLPTSRPDLKWIFDQYTLSEFLVSGATSPQNAVDLWANTLGHVKLLSGGEYVWGCIYAQNGFGVAIAGY